MIRQITARFARKQAVAAVSAVRKDGFLLSIHQLL
jgi:hypothetical protein